MSRFVSKALLTLFVGCLVATGWAKRQVIGKMGQTIEPAKLYATASTRSRVYYSAKAFEYLVVNDSKFTDWLRVRLKNGRDAYILRKSVAKLPYDVSYDTVERGGEVADPTLDRTTLPGYALKYKGTPYVWGGESLSNGIDCSGFVKKLFGKIGVDLPRTAAEQALVGTPITRLDDLQPGDRLYFWETKRNKIGHTGIYMGGGYFIHSSRGNGGVDTDILSARWQKILVAARR